VSAAVRPETLAAMPDELRQRGEEVGPDWGLVRDGAGGFSLVEHAWHLADLEREGFSVRIERLLREAQPFLPDFDGARVARERDYRARSLAEGVRAFQSARRANVATLLSLSAADLERAGEQEGVGRVRLGDLPRLMAGHDDAHRAEIAGLLRDLSRARGARGPLLTTERLGLLPFHWGHEEPLLRLFNHPAVGRYLWDGQPVARATVRALIAASIEGFRDRGFGQFAVARRDDPARLAGFAGLRPFGEADEVELLYALDPAQWKQGLATEAARAVLRFGFEEGGLDVILAGADPPNAASFRVMERLGMSFQDERVVGGLPARYYRIARWTTPSS
jgi:ribosomal-protein-alanine N-acetyltransferase